MSVDSDVGRSEFIQCWDGDVSQFCSLFENWLLGEVVLLVL